tara:strand:+ start:689 stop:1408 length:720 start_codon:yes stop_codon:yes gene_type:complete
MKEINTVYETKDYKTFSFLSNNRNISNHHVNRIINSMKKKRLISPILVNENFQIIDGQHRFLAQKQLKFSIPFVVQEGYGEKETQMLNTTTKNWSLSDWERYYCNKNIKDYIEFSNFRKKYKFDFNVSYSIITGNQYRDFKRVFEEGYLKINNLKRAERNAAKINSISEYFKDYKHREFVRAMLTCFKNKDYNHSKFLSKLAYQGTSLVKCVNIKTYYRLIEDIYNFRTREDTKKLRLF